MLLGGHSNEKAIDDAELEEDFRVRFKDCVQTKAGKTYNVFEPVAYTQQVVAGMIYKIRYKVDDDKYLLAKVFKPLPYTGNPPECMEIILDCAADA